MTIELADVVPHRSVSQLTTYTQCGESYFLQRKAKVPQRPAAWFHHGSAFHHAIEEYELADRNMTIDQAQDIYRLDYDKRIVVGLEAEPDYTKWMTGGHRKGETDIEARRVKGAEQVALYINYAEAHADVWRIWPVGERGKAVEMKFEIEFGGVNTLGFIDQIRESRSGEIYPVDLKSGTKEPVSAFQLAVYAHSIHQNTGVLPATGSFFMPKLRQNGTLVGDVVKDLSSWTRPLLDEMFSGFDKAERAGIYLPAPGDACRVCSVSDFCSVMGDPAKRAEFATIKARE